MKEQKRILFLMSRFLDGGIDTVLLEYLKWFAQSNHYHVTLGIAVCLDDLEVFRDKIPANVEVVYFTKAKWLTYLYKKRVLKSISPVFKAFDELFLVPIRRTLVRYHLWRMIPHYDTLIDFDCCFYALLRRYRIHKLAFFHFSFMHFEQQNHRRMKRIGKRIDYYDQIILIAQGMKDEAVKMFPDKANRFSVIYNPKDFASVEQLAAETPDDEAIHEPFILSVSRLTTPKDIPTLLKAYQLLRNDYGRQEKLYIIGKGDEEEDLRREAVRLGIADDVRFLGFIANPLPWIKACRLLVLSSKFEGLPTVLLEGLMLDKLMVATDCPIGPREVLANGKAGLLTPVGDAPEMAKAIQRLLTDEPLQQEIHAFSQQHKKNFSLQTAGLQIESIMRQLKRPKILFLISRFLDGGIDTVLIDYLNVLTACGKYRLSLAIEQDMDKLEVFLANVPESVKIYHFVESGMLMKWRRKKITQHLSLPSKIYDESILAPIRRFIIKQGLKRLAVRNNVIIDFDCCSYSLLEDIKTPKIAWFHFSFEEMMRTNKRRMIRISHYLHGYHNVVTISRAMYDEGVKLFPQLESKFLIIYNAKNRDNLLHRAKEHVDDERIHQPYILAVERLEESQKDITTLIRAYQILKLHYHHKEKLYLLGKGQSEDELRQLADSLGLADDIVFLGFHANPYPWMKQAKLLAHSAKLEGLPTVLLEGLMLDKLIVSTDCPTGPKEILDNGRAGLLVPVGDAEAMADAIHRMLTDRQLQADTEAHLQQHRIHFMYEETLREFNSMIQQVLQHE